MREGVEPAQAIAEAFLAAIAAGDLLVLDALLHPEARWWILGWGWQARATYLANLSQTITRAAEREMVIEGTTVEGERAAVEATGRFEFREGSYRNSYHFLFVVRGGLIVEGREYFDPRAGDKFFGR